MCLSDKDVNFDNEHKDISQDMKPTREDSSSSKT